MSIFKKYLVTKWVRVFLILFFPLAVCLFLFGRQAFLVLPVYFNFQEPRRLLFQLPEKRPLSGPAVRKDTLLRAFAYSIRIPRISRPRIVCNEFHHMALFPGELLVCVTNPLLYVKTPFERHRERKEPDDAARFRAVFSGRFSNNFEFVRQSMGTVPSLRLILAPLDEALLHYYQLHTKRCYVRTAAKGANRVYYFETTGCKGFQIGNPASSRHIKLWLFPHNEEVVEIGVHGKGKEKLMQEDIDHIIATFGKRGEQPEGHPTTKEGISFPGSTPVLCGSKAGPGARPHQTDRGNQRDVRRR